jgi:hypothetical protein
MTLATGAKNRAMQASGANNAIRELGGVFGVAVLGAVFAANGGYGSGQQFVDGMNPAVMIGAALVAVGAIAAFAIKRSPQSEHVAVASKVGYVKPRHHVDLPGGHRQRRDHRHRPRSPPTRRAGQQHAASLNGPPLPVVVQSDSDAHCLDLRCSGSRRRDDLRLPEAAPGQTPGVVPEGVGSSGPPWRLGGA